jgi:cyanophycinase
MWELRALRRLGWPWLVLMAHAAADGGTALGQASTPSPPRVGPAAGALVAVGGRMTSPEIFRRFIALAGGPDARILVVPTAMGEGDYDDSYGAVQAFRSHGARSVRILHTMDPAVADTDAFVEPLRSADGVFFTGGRQWRLVDAYGGTRTEVELRRVLERGGVIGGNSAGATVLGSFLVRGDTSGNEILIGDHQRGFGYLRDVAIDQHVLRRNRQHDLVQVVERHPELLGIGIDEDTAIVVQGDFFDVIGSSYVTIVDRGAVTGSDGRFYLLAPGDGFHLDTRVATRPSRTDGPVPNVTRNPG